MILTLRLFRALTGALLIAGPLTAQTVFIPSDYFPAQFEFRELLDVQSEQKLESRPEIGRVENGLFLVEAGAQAYARRIYRVEGGTTLSIEVVTLEDDKGAYSLLTVLGAGLVADGPPGDYFAGASGTLCFAQSRYFVRTLSQAPGNLPRRVSTSVSNRIGRHAESLPLLVMHFPKSGYQAASLRYFLGPDSLKAFSRPIAGKYPAYKEPLEIAQAQYVLDGQSGFLTLVSFPTMQMAEEYYDRDMDWLAAAGNSGSRRYSSRAGPLIGILEGNFDPGRADKVLESLHYSYSVKWIYDKYKNSPTLWGLPYGVMSTVVRSIVLVSLLCLLSVVAGAALALFRVALRTYAPHNILDRPERTELIRLKINED